MNIMKEIEKKLKNGNKLSFISTENNGVTIEGKELKSTCFDFVNIKHANLSFLDLKEVTMDYTNLFSSEFKQVDFYKTKIKNSSFEASIFKDVRFNDNDYLENINMSESYMTDMILDNTTIISSNLFNTRIKGTDFNECQMHFNVCDLVSLNDVKIIDSDISETSFDSSKIDNTKIYTCNFRNVIFTESIMNNVSFHETTFTNCNFKDAKLNINMTDCILNECIGNDKDIFSLELDGYFINIFEDKVFVKNKNILPKPNMPETYDIDEIENINLPDDVRQSLDIMIGNIGFRKQEALSNKI